MQKPLTSESWQSKNLVLKLLEIMHFVCRCADKVSPGRFFIQIQYVEKMGLHQNPPVLYALLSQQVAVSFGTFWYLRVEMIVYTSLFQRNDRNGTKKVLIASFSSSNAHFVLFLWLIYYWQSANNFTLALLLTDIMLSWYLLVPTYYTLFIEKIRLRRNSLLGFPPVLYALAPPVFFGSCGTFWQFLITFWISQ